MITGIILIQLYQMTCIFSNTISNQMSTVEYYFSDTEMHHWNKELQCEHQTQISMFSMHTL